MEDEERPGIVRINLSIPDEMSEWLKENPEINKSKVFREAVNQLRAGFIVQTSFYGLGFFIIMSLCVLILLFCLLPRTYFTFVFFAMISIVTIIFVDSAILFSKYRKEINKWKQMNYRSEEKTKVEQNL